MRLVLDMVFYAGFIIAWPWWRGKKRGDWPARWGRGPILPKPAGVKRLLIHGVSVGEVNAAAPLARRLRRDPRFIGVHIVISATTDTGAARAAKLFATPAEPLIASPGEPVRSESEAVMSTAVVRYPLDASRAVRRFFDRIQPDAVALMELELWPNFLAEATRRGVPTAVVNGRLSERSFRNYRRFRPLLGRFFRPLTFVAAQDESYAQRFRAMGVKRVSVVGSMKWDGAADGVADRTALDAQADLLAKEMGIDRSRPLVVAGSTGPEEPAMLVRSIDESAARSSGSGRGVQLLVAPRKPEWFDAAATELERGGHRVVCRSRPESSSPPNAEAPRRFVLDTIGELRAAYALADVVIVGRSFGSLFGSDVMQPAALGKPVLIGPQFGDFASAVEALERSGGLRIVERNELGAALAELLNEPDTRRRMGEAAVRCVAEQAGAAQRHADLLAEMMGLGASPVAVAKEVS